MNKIIKAIKAVWQRSGGTKKHDSSHSIKTSSNSIDGFNAGAKWIWLYQWVSVKEEQPSTDGDYITLIKQEDSDYAYYVEIAPWINGEYQGSRIMGVKFGQEEVTYWMSIPLLS